MQNLKSGSLPSDSPQEIVFLERERQKIWLEQHCPDLDLLQALFQDSYCNVMIGSQTILTVVIFPSL